MAIISHPDKLSASLSDEEKESKKSEFLKIQEAYDILSDPRERMVYDAKLHGVRVFNNPDFIVPPVDIRTDPLAGSTLTTFIETPLFQMKMKITIPMAEIPLITVTHPIITSLNDLYTGVAQRNITYFRRKFCHICQGTGNVKHVPPERVKCPHCVGTRYTWKQILHQNTFPMELACVIIVQVRDICW